MIVFSTSSDEPASRVPMPSQLKANVQFATCNSQYVTIPRHGLLVNVLLLMVNGTGSTEWCTTNEVGWFAPLPLKVQPSMIPPHWFQSMIAEPQRASLS